METSKTSDCCGTILAVGVVSSTPRQKVVVHCAGVSGPYRPGRVGASVWFGSCRSATFSHSPRNPSRPVITSSPTPPASRTIFTVFPTTALFMPPLAGLHAPWSSSPSVVEAAAASRAGGSIVRRDKSLSLGVTSLRLPLDNGASIVATVTAQTASATASSSLDGSKKMLSPTEMTSSVNGGFEVCAESEEGYRGSAASQSSLNRGSSSILDIGAGSLVARRARCVVRLSSGRG